MAGISNINFTATEQPKTHKAKETKKEVVYVSKNPDAVVNATGVVAGTSGMVGGAVLGGLVGASTLPGEYVKQLAGQNYSKVVSDAVAGFKQAVADSPELKAFADAIREAKSPAVAEEIVEIAHTLSDRLHTTFASDPHASAVIDKVVDPFINGISVKKNVRSYGSGLRSQVKSPIGQTIMKFLGFNKKTSTIVGDVTGNMAKGITQAVENIRNFTPEEREAWKNVSREIFAEFENNPKIKLSSNLAKAVKKMTKSSSWITEPLKNLQETIINASKELNKSLGKAPLKTVGIYSGIGAVACGALSTLGWFGLKKGLMKKENEKAVKAGQI